MHLFLVSFEHKLHLVYHGKCLANNCNNDYVGETGQNISEMIIDHNGRDVNSRYFFYLGFLSQPFMNHRTAGVGGVHFYNSSLLLLPASQTLRHQPGNYCRELTSAHRQQLDLNWKPLVSKRKSLTTKPHAYWKKNISVFKIKTQLYQKLENWHVSTQSYVIS